MLINPLGGFAYRLQTPILLAQNRQQLRQNLFNQHLPSIYFIRTCLTQQLSSSFKEEDMINERVIRKLKQTNISENPVKTKARIRELWKTSSKAKKHIVEETAGVSRATIYRAYNTGSVSAKLAVPMAQNFNVDPHYLTGKTDQMGECTNEKLVKFLTSLGYGNLLSIEAEKHPAGTFGTASEIISNASNVNAEDLTLADLHLLMQSLLLRERAGVEEAIRKVAMLKALLLS